MINGAPTDTAGDTGAWMVSHIDRSIPDQPRAIWRKVPPSASRQDPAGSSPARRAAAPNVTSPPADDMALLALVLLLTRGKARALARAQAERFLRAWIGEQGGRATGRLGPEVARLLTEGKGSVREPRDD